MIDSSLQPDAATERDSTANPPRTPLSPATAHGAIPSRATRLSSAADGAEQALLVGGAALAGSGAFALFASAVHPLSLAIAALAWLTLAAFVMAGIPYHPHTRFGAANAITTARAAITVALVALIPEAGAGGALQGDTAWWAVTVAALFSLALDGVDGSLARRAGLQSAFGARYDMEIDALLALVLALLIWRSGELGAWVLVLGTMRYLFLGAARYLPALRAPLYPSLRRKTVCVVQIATLCAVTSPLVTPSLSIALGVAATLALLFSFGRDTHWLMSAARR